MTSDLKTDLSIYQTKEYDQFKLIDVNRRITKNSELERAILNHNKLMFNPLTVTPDMYILDGQHRLQIAKKLDLDVYYMIDPHSTFADVQNLNVGTKIWSRIDHLEFFVKCKEPVYCFINEMLNRFHVNLTSFLKCFTKGRSQRSTISQQFKRGSLQLKYEFEDIERYLDYYEDIYQLYKVYIHIGQPSIPFQSVMLSLITHEDYTHDRMIKSIQKYPETFMSLHNMKRQDIIRQTILDHIYNKRRSYTNHLEV